MLLDGHVHPLRPLISVILPFVNSKTGRIAPGMYELASLASFLHRVEPPLDALERLLHALLGTFFGLRTSSSEPDNPRRDPSRPIVASPSGPLWRYTLRVVGVHKRASRAPGV